jgi:hypothetical protein
MTEKRPRYEDSVDSEPLHKSSKQLASESASASTSGTALGVASESGIDSSSSSSSSWTKQFSVKHNAPYWFNATSGKTSWTEPVPSTSAPAPVRLHVQASHKDNANAGNASNTSNANGNNEWVEKISSKHNTKYWFNAGTGESSWVDPYASAAGTKAGAGTGAGTGTGTGVTATPTPRPLSAEEISLALAREARRGEVSAPGFPWLIKSVDIPRLIQRLRYFFLI